MSTTGFRNKRKGMDAKYAKLSTDFVLMVSFGSKPSISDNPILARNLLGNRTPEENVFFACAHFARAQKLRETNSYLELQTLLNESFAECDKHYSQRHS
jgi:hypothetical protein